MAEQLFLESGFTDTTMQRVATQAGASKETLYRLFVSKEDLFAQVVGNRARRLMVRLDTALEPPNAMVDVLRDLGTNLLEGLMSADGLSLMRIVVAETSRNPALGQIFYAAGPGWALKRLTDFLGFARARGEFRGPDPGRAASIFFGALLGDVHIAQLVLVDRLPASQAEIDNRLNEVLAMFLEHYA